jgi:hypothetical protein
LFLPCYNIGDIVVYKTKQVATNVSLKMLNCAILSAPYLPNQNNRTGYDTYDILTPPPCRNNILLPSG